MQGARGHVKEAISETFLARLAGNVHLNLGEGGENSMDEA